MRCFDKNNAADMQDIINRSYDFVISKSNVKEKIFAVINPICESKLAKYFCKKLRKGNKKVKQPKFWNSVNVLSVVLLPLSFIYNAVSKINLLLQSFFVYSVQSDTKIICVGNVNVGGGGKTQVVLKLIDIFVKNNLRVCVVMQGYKGILSNAPLAALVDVKKHTAFDVGDEPFMVASKTAQCCVNVIVNHSKKTAVKCAEKFSPDVIIMDDGMQNSTVKKHATICVVDGKFGFGNEFVMPAGPLRESVASGMHKSDAVIIVRSDEKNVRSIVSVHGQKNIFNSEIISDIDVKKLHKKNKKIFAFCAIANSEKFFNSVELSGLKISDKKVFSDHYMYTENDIKNIVEKYADNYSILTTDKDYVKISDAYKEFITPFSVALKIDDEKKFERFFLSIIKRG
jgi:tetraacyldisaccharide 4'-kinase